jgi:Tfp pilus assembly major pilin PilA
MQQAPTQGTQPYPGPYYGPPRYYQQKSTGGLLIVILVFIIILGSTGCITVLYINNYASRNYQGRGLQEFNGTVNYTAMIKALKNASFEPSEGGSNPIWFKPFCGALGSKDANETRPLMNVNRNTISYSNTTLHVRYATRTFTSTNYDAEHITTKLKCVMKRAKEIFVNELGMNLVSEHSTKGVMSVPGFEAIAVVSIVVVIVAVRWKRMDKQG